MNYAQALNRAAIRKTWITPKKPNPMAGKRKLHFVLGNDDIDLTKIPGTDPVWSLISYRQLLTEHGNVDIEVFKKANKRGIVSAQVIGGPKIRRGYMRPIDIGLEEYLSAYFWVNDYLAEHGVTFTSSSWASEQIFRMGFKKSLTLSNPIGRTLMKTSRGICRPGFTYRGNIEKWDIRSAYPYAMLSNAHRFPTRLIPIEPDEWDKRDSSLVLAHVICRPSFTELELPIIQEHPTDMENPKETVAWFYDFELRTILENHHHVKPLAAFKIVTADLTDELGRWHSILSPRYMDDIGFAGKILKSIANALWGSFASSLVYAYSWEFDEWGIPQTKEFRRQAYGGQLGAEHVAAWVNALVSDRVFTEFIEPYNVLYFDTDGGFTKSLPEEIGGSDFGQWKFEGYYRKLEIVGWQAYAAWQDDGIDVALSGVPDATYKDLRRYGGSQERRTYISQLVEDDPFSQIAAVEKTGNLVTTIPTTIATLDADRWQQIDPAIAPHASMVKALHKDQVEVTDRQALGFRSLAEFDLTNDPDQAYNGVAPRSNRSTNERKVQHGERKEEVPQGRFWDRHS